MYEVAYYDKSESNLEKIPKTFNNYTYDNVENGGVLNKFSEIGDKIKSIKTDISNLNTEYGNIIKKYERFSNFETSMNSIINTMTTRIDNINTCYSNILSTAQQAVKDHMASDKTLIDDLDSINALLAGKTGLEAGLKNTGNNAPLSNEAISDLEFKNSHGGVSQEEWNRMSDSQKQEKLKEQAAQQGGNITNQNETAVDDKYSMSGDLDKIADDIIQGKYGNGEDRFAELEKQGYTLRDQYVVDKNGEKTLVARGIQDIVNEKMNGTYDPSKTPTYASNGTDRGYPSSTEVYDSQKAAAQAAVTAATAGGVAQTNYYKNLQEKQASTVNPGGSVSSSTAGANSIPSQAQIIQENMNILNGTNNTPSQAQINLEKMMNFNGANNAPSQAQINLEKMMNFNGGNNTPSQAQNNLDKALSFNVNNNSISPSNYTKDIIRDAFSNSNTASTTSSGSRIELSSDPVE